MKTYSFNLRTTAIQDSEIVFVGCFELQSKNGETQGLFHACRYHRARNNIIAVGYCAHDCPGHPTPSQALEHYRQFLLDDDLLLNESWPKPNRGCLVCCGETNHAATIYCEFRDRWIFPLCDTHRTRAEVERLFVLESFFGVAEFTRIDANLGSRRRENAKIAALNMTNHRSEPDPQK